MKWIARIALVLMMTVLAAGGLVMSQAMHSLPRLDGALRLTGLSQTVQVRRDSSDVTHIEGASALDVWRTLGFVHAQAAFCVCCTRQFCLNVVSYADAATWRPTQPTDQRT
jgi:acyl-homoserine lactone acylase PvdQ